MQPMPRWGDETSGARRFHGCVQRIDFYCDAYDHQTWTPGGVLTLEDERPAYCPMGETSGHHWQPAGGILLVLLKRRLAAVALATA